MPAGHRPCSLVWYSPALPLLAPRAGGATVKSRQTRRAIATAAPALLVLLGGAESAWPQSATPSAGGSSTALLVGGAIVVALLLLTGFMVKLFDLKRQCEAEAVHLQAQ